MANEVVIKSNRYGLNLILDDQTPFPGAASHYRE